MSLEKNLAYVLRTNRQRRGLTQEELANRCGIDRTYISMIERGKRKPTLNILFKICEHIGTKPSDFIKEIEDMMDSNICSK